MAVDSERRIDQQHQSEDFLETVDGQNNTLFSDSDYQYIVKALKGKKSIWATNSHGYIDI